LDIYKDSIATIEICIWIAGTILTLSILRDTCAPAVPIMWYDSHMARYSDVILDTVPFIDAKWCFNKGPLNLIFPLKIIVLLSPLAKQRDMARSKLKRWDKGIGSGGCLSVPSMACGNLYNMGVLNLSYH
jgi:hypothetical protein